MSTPAPKQSQLELVIQDSEAFARRVVSVCALSTASLATIYLIAGLLGPTPGIAAVTSGLGITAAVVTYALNFRGHTRLAARLYLFGLFGVLLTSLVQPANPGTDSSASALLVILLVTLGAFLLTRADVIAMLVMGVLLIGAGALRNRPAGGWHNTMEMVMPVLTIGLMLLDCFVMLLFTSNARENHEKLKVYIADTDRVMARAQRIAQGDLSGEVEGDSEVSTTIRAMLAGLRGTVARVREASSTLAASTQEIAAMARQQEQGVVEQASAVTEIRATLDALLAASTRVAQSTDDVFRNVEATQKTSEAVAARAAALSAHTRRISAILDVIKGIANKSEILALNAALEGARAGEAGRGFSLVASQMQRLAESVMDSVKDVRALTEDIESATNATLLATEESTKLSAAATVAARQIGATAQQQRSSTEQVATAMGDINEVARQVASGAGQSLAATRDLAKLAEDLNRTIEHFRLEAP